MKYCPKCGAPLNTDKEYCIRCGSMLTKEALSGEHANFDAEYIKREKIDFDSLLKLYVGDRYDKIDAVNFNPWHLIFTAAYSFYRRYYSMAIFSMIVFAIVNILLGLTLPFIVSHLPYGLDKMMLTTIFLYAFFMFLTSYLLSRNYNRKYLMYASTKVKKIMYSDKNKDAETIRRKCKKRGNPSILYCIIGWFLTGTVIATISILISLLTYFINIYKEKNAYKIGDEICKNVSTNINSYNFPRNTFIDLENVKGLGNDYTGSILIYSNDSVYLLAASRDNVYCTGICGTQVKCHLNVDNELDFSFDNLLK